LKTIQTNVRVPPEDKAVIAGIAARLRSEPGFREKLVALLDDRTGPGVNQRLEKLEEQMARLESGAIVVPRARPPAAITLPKGVKPASR
jgi:hypothetical protein